ncbi:glucose-1-phosphate adenylyltransferase [Pseudanabaena galeata UHCC 0370]|jgi:glucose-1-phosphate adenylyltransferase|uniref:Glucose-1-phosphate adenylyltransferase n=1 Tax=Pseudanabaena galeata UHCC 0370 TaxID=3110310 RepID=A0ABU5TQU2_9CYAN|nr:MULTISPECIES: glucose-1-phosphate adenylyltransferase [Pseudanabaena]MEA5479863.1 glucose-1-phosphate adenylyltransferase [Pseudanabaena galeata UHCC 0370]MEA5486284.1 glucose-1-phosphate adenylyltransferase [Pseudanabaena sp. CCNP1317]WGS71595.1 glucose-1-phosphate adenylyltransferase [Pseudanabaena galeata CCNP1313]
MKNVLAIILGGGQGSRLYPLTKTRAKPAVPVAGKYRLIDIPVSNCINSGIEKIYILTQFNSASLNRHVNQAYRPASYSDGFVEILAAQQTPDSPDWFQGTADAVRRYAWLLESWNVTEYLILSGDQLYNMDYAKFVEHHRNTGADITLSVLPVDQKKATAFGLLKTDAQGRIIKFLEKPKGEALEEMRVDTTSLGLSAEEAKYTPFIASMGIYVFNKTAMMKMLSDNPDFTDFGKEIIPNAIHTSNVQAYLFSDYWEDIGTIESFYQANLDLTRHPDTAFNFYETKKPIYTRARYLPPSKAHDCKIKDSIIGEGCLLSQATITNSVVGIRMHIDANCTIEDTLLMGCDFYQPQEDRKSDLENSIVPMGIGENTIIRHAIIDKNARIGKNVQIINKDRVQDVNREDQGYCICNGIVVVVKNAVIPDNTII